LVRTRTERAAFGSGVTNQVEERSSQAPRRGVRLTRLETQSPCENIKKPGTDEVPGFFSSSQHPPTTNLLF
jgi:hypothetical protein